MNSNNQRIKKSYAVLQTLKQELEQTTNYVQRIIALQNIATILKMLTEYRVLGEEIERNLSISGNFSDRRITAYNMRIKTLLSEKILSMEATICQHSAMTLL